MAAGDHDHDAEDVAARAGDVEPVKVELRPVRLAAAKDGVDRAVPGTGVGRGDAAGARVDEVRRGVEVDGAALEADEALDHGRVLRGVAHLGVAGVLDEPERVFGVG